MIHVVVYNVSLYNDKKFQCHIVLQEVNKTKKNCKILLLRKKILCCSQTISKITCFLKNKSSNVLQQQQLSF